jgi:hypothetical protein
VISAFVVEGPAYEGKQGDLTGAFDRPSQLALMPGAGAGLAARANFPLLSDETAQYVSLFVINCHVSICTKLADFWAGVIATFLPSLHLRIHRVIHKNIYSNLFS